MFDAPGARVAALWMLARSLARASIRLRASVAAWLVLTCACLVLLHV